jgi:V-type H+-transporting ATPase subunit a
MAFINSFKMKAAVIFGVVHMLFGLGLKLNNNIRQKKMVDLFTITIPQILFLLCTFAYMDFLIIFKWNSTYSDTKDAPSIISTMIAVYVNMAKEGKGDHFFWSGERSF